jgi:GT2 family glycosyltransferase
MNVRASIVIVGFGAEEFLEECLSAVDDDASAKDEILVVDNGVEDLTIRRTSWPARVTVLDTGDNLGFAGGVNFGVRAGQGDYVVLLNSDAIVRPGAIAALVEAASTERATVAAGCLRLADSPETVNSAGNPLHFLGLCWSGGHGEPASDHEVPGPVATASGGFLAMRRSLWDKLEGFNETYFAYQEDVELSVRAWLAGAQVSFVPSAVALHHYDFSRNPQKMYLLERNRLMTVLTVYPTTLLRRIAPALAVCEIALSLLAANQGWLRQKLSGYRWLWTHRRALRARRASLQAGEGAGDHAAEFISLLTARLDPGMIDHPPFMRVANSGMAVYWRFVRPSAEHG